MKKIFLLALLASTCLPLVGCDDVNELFADKDFDGLYDIVDPTPDSNISGFKFDNGEETNEIRVKVDYRNFIYDDKPTYNKDLGQVAALIANYSYEQNRHYWDITTSEYVTEESSVNPFLVQFGFNDIRYVKVNGFDTDKNDACGLFFGNHIFYNKDTKYQIFAVSVEGYLGPEMWNSNLDLGSNTENYFEASGEHPEWLNKKNHKGFDITVNRAIAKIEEYVQDWGEKNAQQIIFVTGHSRGGALSNLIGKQLKDKGYKSLAYCFNGPRTTEETDETILKHYTNIFNIDSVHDFVCRYPFKFMNFTSYGNFVNYDLVANNEYYKSIFNKDFAGNSEENLRQIDVIAKAIFISREGMYDYSPIDPNVSEFELCEDYDAAVSKKAELDEEINSCHINGFAKTEILENEDVLTSDEFKYKVQYYSRPAALFTFVATVIVTIQNGGTIIDIINAVSNGVRYISRYIGQALDIGGIELDIAKFSTPHIQTTCIAGAYVAK